MKWRDQMPWSLFSECWALSQAFSLSSFIFIKRLFTSSSLSAIRVVSSAYLKLLIFLPVILIPVYTSPSLVFGMMYSAQKLNKQGDNIQLWCTPFPVLNQSVVPCPVLFLWPLATFRQRGRTQRKSDLALSPGKISWQVQLLECLLRPHTSLSVSPPVIPPLLCCSIAHPHFH